MSRSRLFAAGLALAAGSVVWPAGPAVLSAQTDPRLVAAVKLARDGLSDSARSVVGRILAGTAPTDSSYPEVLYTAGLVAATERDRRLAFRRIVVDYGQSPWADDALLNLAQLDYASGNPEGTVRQVEQLIRDYPESPLHAPAALWGSRAANDRRDPATGCRLADIGLAAAGSDVELRNQLEFQRQRCRSLGAMQAEAARAAAEDSATRARADSTARANRAGRPAGPPAVSPASRTGYYVQLSAVATQSAATAEVARFRRAGFQPVVLRESGLFKIRIGPYPARAEANAALARARSRFGGRPFVVHVP
jgi:cell division septation protein DedD